MDLPEQFENTREEYDRLELELEENLKHSRVKLMIKLEKQIWRRNLIILSDKRLYEVLLSSDYNFKRRPG